VVEDIIIKDKSGNPVTGAEGPAILWCWRNGKPQESIVRRVPDAGRYGHSRTAPGAEGARDPGRKAGGGRASTQARGGEGGDGRIRIAPEKPGDIKYKDRRLNGDVSFDMTSMPLGGSDPRASGGG